MVLAPAILTLGLCPVAVGFGSTRPCIVVAVLCFAHCSLAVLDKAEIVGHLFKKRLAGHGLKQLDGLHRKGDGIFLVADSNFFLLHSS